MRKNKNGKSIRSKIVFGYSRIYMLISFILLILFFGGLYFGGYYYAQSHVEDDIQSVLKALPEYNEDIDVEELYETANKLMPSYVLRYDVIYEETKIRQEDIYYRSNFYLSDTYNNNEMIYIEILKEATGAYVEDNNGQYMTIAPITPTPEPTPNQNATLAPDEIAHYDEADLIDGYVTSTYLNVRVGPGVTYTPIAQLTYGTKISIIEEGEWDKILLHGNVVYVASLFVTTGESPTPTPAMGNEFWLTQEVHLFSKSGTATYTTGSFDWGQYRGPLNNLKEIYRLYSVKRVS